jgi:YidC/Oxa1 family membrane protein insertase
MPIKSNNYEGLWVTIFVQPLAWIIIKIGNLVKSYGLALILCTLLIRGICYPITKKNALQSEKLKQMQPKLNKLEKKYENRTDQESMMQKSQEMMMIYKENNFNPMSGCLFSLIQIPLFFAFYEAITRIPAIFEENFLSFQLGTSPYVAIFEQGKWLYLILIILVVVATYFSFKLNSSSVSSEQAEQMKTMTNIMVVMMAITAFSISSGIAIYWITSNVFTIVQNLLVKRGVKNG